MPDSLRCPHWIIGVVVLALAGSTSALQVTQDSAIEELRVRSPGGNNDVRTVVNWLEKEIQRLSDGPQARQTQIDFVNSITRLRNASDTTQGFRDLLADQLSALSTEKLSGTPQPSESVAASMVRAMTSISGKRVAAGLAAALTHASAEVRYLAARGLQLSCEEWCQSQPAETRDLIEKLNAAAISEPNGVIVDRIYRALSLDTATQESLTAIIEVVGARVAAYDAGRFLADTAEPTVFEYLSRTALTPAQTSLLIPSLAKLLRLDVERYVAGDLRPENQSQIEIRIDACESLLEKLINKSPDRTIRSAMQSGDPAVTAIIQLQLIEWIGDEDNDGLMTGPPANVPRGAP
jgi:hypothetical protein